MRKEYKFKFRISIDKGFFHWRTIKKFRGANFVDLHILGLRISWGMPYLKKFIWSEGYDTGFRAAKQYYKKC